MDLNNSFFENLKPTFKVIIAGGREFTGDDNFELLAAFADEQLAPIKDEANIVVMSGTARGADRLGEQYARSRGYQIHHWPADWDKYGKSAGYRRNEDMAGFAHALIACWDGASKGTNHMINLAKTKGLQVEILSYSPV
jgi:hypothetical protein